MAENPVYLPPLFPPPTLNVIRAASPCRLLGYMTRYDPDDGNDVPVVQADFYPTAITWTSYEFGYNQSSGPAETLVATGSALVSAVISDTILTGNAWTLEGGFNLVYPLGTTAFPRGGREYHLSLSYKFTGDTEFNLMWFGVKTILAGL